jgi:3-oxoacyl-[acyl-carrier-protein] synthase II
MTGAGLVTSLASSAPGTWEKLLQGERAIGPVDLFETEGLRARLAAQVRTFDAAPPSRTGKRWSRTSTLAWNAAREAIAMAGLDVRTTRVGLVVGGTTGGMFENEAILATLHQSASRAPAEVVSSPLVEILSHPLSAAGDSLHEALGPFAAVSTLCSACSSGANALLLGATWLLEGKVDAVVAGGTDGLCRLTFSGFNALQAMDPDPCRPFDRRRKGLNMGEGAGFVVLERARDAAARGATPVAALVGWAASSEAHHITNPEPTGAVAALTLVAALARAGLSPADIDYVNAHGTATPLNDAMESSALARALGEDVRRVLVSSSKAQIGHTLGAAGAIEAIFAAFAVRDHAVPPTVGLDDPDPACSLVHVPNVGREARVRAALSSSFGFGGMDTVLVFAAPGGSRSADATTGRGRDRSVVVTGAACLTAAGLDDAATASVLASPLGTGAADVAAARAGAKAGRLDLDVNARLDAARARRLDRPARLGAVVCERALGESRVSGSPVAKDRLGVVLGSAFGSVDGSAAFMHRLFEKGARLASPAEFPNLVPSSPVGHVTIYLGVHGPALAVADLATSGESAALRAAELIAHGEADALVAGAMEEASVIVESVFSVLFARATPDASARDGSRGEGAGAIVLEASSAAEARGARVLARLASAVEWRDAGGSAALGSLPSPEALGAGARVVLARPVAEIDALLAPTPWSAVPRVSCRARAGDHEALGAVALVVGTSLIARGEARTVLVLGLARGRGYAFVLAEPGHA